MPQNSFSDLAAAIEWASFSDCTESSDEESIRRWSLVSAEFPDSSACLKEYLSVLLKNDRYVEALPLVQFISQRYVFASTAPFEWVSDFILRATVLMCNGDARLVDSQDGKALLLLALRVSEICGQDDITKTLTWQFLTLKKNNLHGYKKSKIFIDNAIFLRFDPCSLGVQGVILYLSLIEDEVRSDFFKIFMQYRAVFRVRDLEQIFSLKPNFDFLSIVSSCFSDSTSLRLFSKIVKFVTNFSFPPPVNTPLSIEPVQVRSTAADEALWAKMATEGFRPTRLASPPHIIHGQNKCLAVCISGQLRGFQKIFSGWKETILKDIECDIYVSVWAAIGGKQLIPLHADRILPPHACVTYRELCAKHGLENINAMFPTLINALETKDVATSEQLQELYQPRAMIIDDDNLPPFSKMHNVHKMFFKINSAHNLLQQSGTSYEAVLRIRPDIEIVSGSLHGMIASIKAGAPEQGHIFVDQRPKIDYWGGLSIGDQIALADKSTMDIYASIWDNRDLPKQPMTGFERWLWPHRSLAYVLMASSVVCEQMTITRGGYGDINRFSPSEIIAMIMMDEAGRASRIGTELLRALEQDEAQQAGQSL